MLDLKSYMNLLPITVFIDNKGAAFMAMQQVNNRSTGHIHLSYHGVRDEIAKGKFILQYVHSEQNPSDIFTKALNAPAHYKCLEQVMNPSDDFARITIYGRQLKFEE